MRHLLSVIAFCVTSTLVSFDRCVQAQGFGLPNDASQKSNDGRKNNPRAGSTPPSLQKNASTPTGTGASRNRELPRTAGQEHRVYDLRPYTGYLTKHDHPEGKGHCQDETR